MEHRCWCGCLLVRWFSGYGVVEAFCKRCRERRVCVRLERDPWEVAPDAQM